MFWFNKLTTNLQDNQKKRVGTYSQLLKKKPIVLSKLLFYKYIIFFTNHKKKRAISDSLNHLIVYY